MCGLLFEYDVRLSVKLYFAKSYMNIRTIDCSYPFGCGQFLFIQKLQYSCIFNIFKDIQISIKDFENAPKLTPNKNIAPKMHTENQTKIRMGDYVHSLFRSIKSPCLVKSIQR